MENPISLTTSKIIKPYKRVWQNMDITVHVRLPSFWPNHVCQQCFPLNIHYAEHAESGLRLNDGILSLAGPSWFSSLQNLLWTFVLVSFYIHFVYDVTPTELESFHTFLCLVSLANITLSQGKTLANKIDLYPSIVVILQTVLRRISLCCPFFLSHYNCAARPPLVVSSSRLDKQNKR